MIALEIDGNADLDIEDVAMLGGRFGIMDKLKMGGHGSTKIIYKTGIPHFDNFSRKIDGETPFVSFEIMKEALILRLNQNQRTAAVAIRMHNLQDITLHAADDGTNPDIDFKAELCLSTPEASPIFIVTKSSFDSIRKFFSKAYFKNRLVVKIG